MDGIALLDGVLGKTADLVDGVGADDWDKPTPCPDFTVHALVAHMAGWAPLFEAAARGRTPEGDPAAYQVSERTPAEFRAAVAGIAAGWAANGTDRSVSLVGAAPLPAQMVLDMTVMEYLAHGWDLARGSGQPMPYTDEEAQAVLDLARNTLPAQYRGEGKAFGDIVEVPETAPVIDRFAGFMGRRP